MICLSELGRIRSELIDWLSEHDVIDLLHYLRMMDVLNDQEMKTVEEKMTREDGARCLIDTVMEKGEELRSFMTTYGTTFQIRSLEPPFFQRRAEQLVLVLHQTQVLAIGGP